MTSNSTYKELTRCPDCGRNRPKAKDLCACGYQFPHHPEYSKKSAARAFYNFFWSNKYKRKNTISALIVLAGILVIAFGYYIESEDHSKYGVPEYYKVQDAYAGTDKYYKSSEDSQFETAYIYKLIGAAVMCLGLIAIFSQWLIRPMNANSARHNKYDWR